MILIDPKVTNIVKDLVENRLIPFLGAGVSFDTLKVDWNALRLSMCHDLSIDEASHCDPLKVADLFEASEGRAKLALLLSKSLLVSDHDDASTRSHLAILSMNCGVIYTTNQDNVFEKMTEAKGRIYKRIVSLADLSSVDPTMRKYVKYHGDLSEPDSIIFTGKSYNERISNADHFLNIRMRADLLAKGFLFIGYSFNDPNVRLLFESIRSAFPAGIPKSYLIAFKYEASLEVLHNDFGVEIIDPKASFAESLPNHEAFNRLLEGISQAVFDEKSSIELANIFSPSDQSSTRVVIPSEFACAHRCAQEAPFSEAVRTFRLAVDQANIPTNLIEKVVETVKLLSDRVSSPEELDELPGLLFNLNLSPRDACIPIAWMMKAVNRHGNAEGMPTTHLVFPPMNSVVAGSLALALASLKEENKVISKGFLNHIDLWLQEFSFLNASMQASTKELVTWAYGGRVPAWTFDRPNIGLKTFDQIMGDLEAKIPKKFRRKLTD